jgi:hypothetical protein
MDILAFSTSGFRYRLGIGKLSDNNETLEVRMSCNLPKAENTQVFPS